MIDDLTMARQVTHYKCLVISPSDVDDAREAVVQALLDWNAHAGEGLGVKLEAVRWESHARPEMGDGPQQVLNKQIVDDCDFGVAVFWSRLGSPTPEHPSGSVEEIERLLAKGANVMVYFCDAPIPQKMLVDDQYRRLQEVKSSFRERGILANYQTVDDLRRVVPLHVNGLVNSLLIQQRAAGLPIPSQGTATAPIPDIRVTVSAALLNPGPSMFAGIVVEVQNHSPNDFFFSSLLFQRSDGSQLFVQQDFATGEYLTPRKIEPGNSFTFVVNPQDFYTALAGHEPTTVVAKDKIDRRFRSREGELAAALRGAQEHIADLRKLRA